ncbi:hypothetical protein BCY86_04670 [Pajaroellobacter abortibovis]|uniref:PDZ domain-containing protein n=2 Tax=Pajaroellobacter abortibovis TaxID=1882918 RepID=A0A1L6MWX1_9BACT|nr:hypothetical protein BCY86_04670 [Pajaroellobacter abortibovis]
MVDLKTHYRVLIEAPEAHLVTVQMHLQANHTLPSPLVLWMPVWTPGSYLIQEYARFVEGLTCKVEDASIETRKIRKNAWEVDTKGARNLLVEYRIYCHELTVRTNHVDSTHAFLNGAATFLTVMNALSVSSTVEIVAPEGWQVSTILPFHQKQKNQFEVTNFDTLVDSPLEIGTHGEESFQILGKLHRLAIWPAEQINAVPVNQLVEDISRIVDVEASLFGNTLPYEEYLFLFHLSPQRQGGLEHRCCSTILIDPIQFKTQEGYMEILSLVAHEVFHLWNVKRIRPQGLTPYRYEEENYTKLLWWFEGATSYYEWRVLRLAKLCTVQEYISHLGMQISQLLMNPGRLVQSVEEASWDAWIKFYRSTEDSINSSVNYYQKGEIICALLDLELRIRTKGRCSLDSLLLALWREYGEKNIAVPEDGLCAFFESKAQVPLKDLFQKWIRNPGDLDVENSFAQVGLMLVPVEKAQARDWILGMSLSFNNKKLYVKHVIRGSEAQRVGISAGDEIVALNGKRVEQEAIFEGALAPCQPGDQVELITSRDGCIHISSIQVGCNPSVELVARSDASKEEQRLFCDWLNESHPIWNE